MATVSELVGQQWTSGESASASRKYWVEGAASAASAVSLARAVAPAMWGSLVRKSEDANELGADIYEVTVNYSTRPPAERGDPATFSFEIGTQTTKLFHSHATVNYPSSVNHNGAINVKQEQGKPTPEGVDIFVPTFTWEETHHLDPAVVASYGWLTTAEAMTAKINAAPWRIWAAKELLFMGVSGQSKGGDVMPVTFKFASSKTRVGMTIGGQSGITKAGWDYLWVEYTPEVNSTNLTAQVKAVHVEQVYQTADFGLLGLASPWN